MQSATVSANRPIARRLGCPAAALSQAEAEVLSLTTRATQQPTNIRICVNSGRCTLVYLCAGPDTAIANSSSPPVPVLGSRLPILRGRRSHFVRPVLGAQNSRLWPGSISGWAIGVRAITNYEIADTGSPRICHPGSATVGDNEEGFPAFAAAGKRRC